MTFDSKVPLELRKNQEWFASIITRPVDTESKMMSLSPSGKSMEIEASEYIVPSPFLKPAQRIQIYNQQYWWRLLSNLHEIFPFLTRLFGYYHFNQTIGVPYLIKYPPKHWAIGLIGNRLPRWISEEYQGQDQSLVYEAASIDLAFTQCFLAPQPSSLASEFDLSTILNQKLYLQEHVFLFELKKNLFEARTIMNKESPEYWEENGFPPFENAPNGKFIISRNQRNHVTWDTIPSNAFKVLCRFKDGETIENVCHWIEEQGDDHFLEEANANFHLWFQKWIALHWLGSKPLKEEALKA